MDSELKVRMSLLRYAHFMIPLSYWFILKCGKATELMWLQLQKPSLRTNLKSNSLKQHSSTIQTWQVYFHRWQTIKIYILQGLWSQWVALIRMCGVPNCCQWLSQPTLSVDCVFPPLIEKNTIETSLRTVFRVNVQMIIYSISNLSSQS